MSVFLHDPNEGRLRRFRAWMECGTWKESQELLEAMAARADARFTEKDRRAVEQQRTAISGRAHEITEEEYQRWLKIGQKLLGKAKKYQSEDSAFSALKPARAVANTEPRVFAIPDPKELRKIQKEFESLLARQWSLLQKDTHPRWLKAYYSLNRNIGRWRIEGGELDGILRGFRAVATRAGVALGCPVGVEPVDFWISYVLGQRSKLGMMICGDESAGCVQGLLEASRDCSSMIIEEAYRTRSTATASKDGSGGDLPNKIVALGPLTGEPPVLERQNLDAALNEATQLATNAKERKQFRVVTLYDCYLRELRTLKAERRQRSGTPGERKTLKERFQWFNVWKTMNAEEIDQIEKASKIDFTPSKWALSLALTREDLTSLTPRSLINYRKALIKARAAQ
ncbi:MAG: hypothetical protein M3N41_00865 [Acidobacteriota bacterium]|nr:hypothetical protein [Acidobacteriota bacterium]